MADSFLFPLFDFCNVSLFFLSMGSAFCAALLAFDNIRILFLFPVVIISTNSVVFSFWNNIAQEIIILFVKEGDAVYSVMPPLRNGRHYSKFEEDFDCE